MNSLNNVSVVIVLYKETFEIISKTLNQIRDLEIIIIDNDSNLDLKKKICSNFNISKYILNKKNVGFSIGYNQGVNLSESEFILLLGPDCLISKKSIKILLLKHEAYDDALVLSPTAYDEKNHLSYTGGFLPENGNKDTVLKIDGDTCVESILGACMLIKRENLVKFNLYFDENFFLYFSDDDLCRRIKNLKKSVIQVKDATCIHKHGIIKLKNKYHKIYVRNFNYNYDLFYYHFKNNDHKKIINTFRNKLPKLYRKLLIKLLFLRLSDSIDILSKLFAYYKFKSKYLK